ncbi:MAG: hypothetical protein WBB76_01375 [Gaiellaceae bacterium]
MSALLSAWIALVSIILGGLTGVVVYILVVFGPHYPDRFWFSVALGLAAGLACSVYAILLRQPPAE